MGQCTINSLEAQEELDKELSRPSEAVVQMMKRLTGDIVILGISGKMGLTLGRMAAEAVEKSGKQRRVIGVSRFSDEKARQWLEDNGVQTICCDLLDADAVGSLPDAANVIFMVGRKFGTAGSEAMTWGINMVTSANAARRYAKSNMVVFSTGCVYPLVDVKGDGCVESIPPSPVGEYAQSCLGRERIFQYFCETQQTPMSIYRLNYAIDLRYGVMHDIAMWIWEEKPVPLNVPVFNCIWQRDANERALLCLEHCIVPADILNVTGSETLKVKEVAQTIGKYLDKPVNFCGEPGSKAYLSDAKESILRFGSPAMSVESMIDATASWIKNCGITLNKPTHFEVSNGEY
jgi:nucleoside-diphosphate-sugar epimerase